MIENQKRRKVKVLRSDNRSEYTSTEFKAYLAGKGIEYQLSISGRPKQNGIAERMNRILTERVRNIRFHADISEGFWVEAVNHTSNLVNRSPSTVVDLRSQKRDGEESLWIIQPYRFSVFQLIVWLIVRKGTN